MKAVSSIVNDFKILSDNALIEYDADKSIEYLENIISIDPDNIPVLLELGNIYCQYKSDIPSGQVYINQAIFFARKAQRDTPTELAECHFAKGVSYLYNRKYKESINSIRKSLSFYAVPNVPEIDESSDMEIDSLHIGSYPMTTANDTSLVCNAYSVANAVYGMQGKYRLVLDINNIIESYMPDSEDYEALLTRFISEELLKFQAGLYETVIEDLNGIMDSINDVEFSDAHVVIYYLLANCFSETSRLDSVDFYADKIIHYYRHKKKNYFDQYYIGTCAIKTKVLLEKEQYLDALSCINDIENEVDLEQSPFQDLTSMIYNNKGVAYMGLEEYDKALVELLKANNIQKKMHDEGSPVNAMNILLNSNISAIYGEKNDLENALEYIYQAFSQCISLYKEIGYEHPLVYVIVNQMYLLEIESRIYKDAMKTAIICYTELDDAKYLYRERIDECLKLANESKQYRKQKEYRELLSVYKEFVEEYPD